MKRSIEMTPRRKRQSLYLGLLAMAAIFALTDHDGAWLAIALAAALLIDEILYLIAKYRHGKKSGEASELIETTGVEVKKEEETEKPDSDGHQE